MSVVRAEQSPSRRVLSSGIFDRGEIKQLDRFDCGIGYFDENASIPSIEVPLMRPMNEVFFI